MKQFISIITLCFLGTALFGQPEYFNYQGLLKDSNGDPLDSGAYTMEFSIYDAPSDGTLIWGPFILDGVAAEGHGAQVQIINGQFNVILGPTDTGSRKLEESFGGNSAYVEMSVNGGDPILPRQRILSTPYAFSATTATTLEYLPPVQYRNPAGMITPFAGTIDKIPEGWLLCDGTEYKADDYPELFDTIGTSWGGEQRVEDEVPVDYFNVPDMRGLFLRGANNSRSDGFADPNADARLDAQGTPSEDAGTLQSDAIIPHRHIWGDSEGGDNDVFTYNSGGSRFRVLEYDGSVQIDDVIGSDDFEDNFLNVRTTQNLYTKPNSTIYESGESRPNNAAVNYIIKI